LTVAALPAALAAENSLENFTAKRTYDNRFTDVSANSFYYAPVGKCFELGLVSGTSATKFTPSKNMNMTEILTLAARLHSIFTTGRESFVQGNPWYQVYLDYAKKHGFHPAKVDSYSRTATRAEVVSILSAVMPPFTLSPLNVVEDNAIPDVKMSDPYAAAIYQFYRAGIASGLDKAGSFKPNNGIQRAEVVTLVARIVDPSLRLMNNFFAPNASNLTAEQVSQKCMDAVFFIELFDRSDLSLGYASGFFLTSDGLAASNLHVVAGATRATVTTSDGKKHQVEGIYSANKAYDLSIIKVKGTGFKTLALGDPDKLSYNETVYAIGYPQGVKRFLTGTVYNPRQPIDGMTVITFYANTQPGSSGGALVNRKGQVVGITAGSFDTGERYAIPINELTQLKRISLRPLVTNFQLVSYPGIRQAPYFEIFTGARLTGLTVRADGSLTATYDKKSLGSDDDYERAMKAYRAELVANGMTQTEISGGWRFTGASESLEVTVKGNVITIKTTVKPKYYANSGGAIDLGWYLNLPVEFMDYYDGEYIYYYDATPKLNIFQLDDWLADYYFAALEAAGLELVFMSWEGDYFDYYYINDDGYGLYVSALGDSYYAILCVWV